MLSMRLSNVRGEGVVDEGRNVAVVVVMIRAADQLGQRSGTSFEEVRDECCGLYSVTPLLKNKLIFIEMEAALLSQ